MESYTTIKKYAIFEYEDRKSRFIGEAIPISSEEEALSFISEIKKKYPNANHHVYAYVLRDNNIMRYSDDKEPQGTAGMPVLDVIRKNNCTDAAIVVTRYFGGTLLGTGGLVRAYTAAASGAFLSAEIITYDIYTSMNLYVSYSDYQKVSPILSNFDFRVENTKYSDNVEISGKIKSISKEAFLKNMTEITSGRANIDIRNEQFDY